MTKTAGSISTKRTKVLSNDKESLERGEDAVIFHKIFEAAPDAILAVSPGGKILLANHQAESMFSYNKEEFFMMSVELLMPKGLRAGHATHREHFEREPHTRPMGAHLNLVARRSDGTEFPVDISLSPLLLGKRTYVITIIRDITERRKVENERERLLGELQSALATVKTLRGLLPICAWCKKIRDDKGYWSKVEEYVAQRTEAEFTHGICPECAQKLHRVTPLP